MTDSALHGIQLLHRANCATLPTIGRSEYAGRVHRCCWDAVFVCDRIGGAAGLAWRAEAAAASNSHCLPALRRGRAPGLRPFLTYRRDYGGLVQRVHPLTDEFTEISPTNDKEYTVQYFERPPRIPPRERPAPGHPA